MNLKNYADMTVEEQIEELRCRIIAGADLYQELKAGIHQELRAENAALRKANDELRQSQTLIFAGITALGRAFGDLEGKLLNPGGILDQLSDRIVLRIYSVEDEPEEFAPPPPVGPI